MRPIPLHVAHTSGTNAAGVHQDACTQCGDCCGGCNVGAKTTVASTYLADAAAFGAEIFTEMRVLSLAKEPDGRWKVWLRPLYWEKQRTQNIAITCDIVVLGAGTLGSTEILLRSQRQGLPVSDWLGSRFTSNGDAIAIAYNNDVPVNGVGVGHPQKARRAPGRPGGQRADRPARRRADVRDGIAMCECALPSAFAPLLPALLAPGGAVFGEHGVPLGRRPARRPRPRRREPAQGRLPAAPCTTRRPSSPSATTPATAS